MYRLWMLFLCIVKTFLTDPKYADEEDLDLKLVSFKSE